MDMLKTIKANVRAIGAIFLVLLTFHGVPALANTDIFYGQQSLNSLVDGDKKMVNLPGGTRLETEHNQIAYAINDHTGSARLAMRGDNTISSHRDYTPFGDSKMRANTVTRHYTGMSYEPETTTYDYHARRYDPTIARFTSLDAIRQSISPYSYTENDPINFVDPNGMGRVTLFLYSMYVCRISLLLKFKIFSRENSKFKTFIRR